MKAERGVFIAVLLAFSMLVVPFFGTHVAKADELVLNIDGTRSTSSQTVEPGGYTDFYMILTNNNVTDSMTVKMTAYGVATGFSVMFLNDSGGPQSVFTVPASNTTDVTVRVYADAELAGGVSDSFSVVAEDQTRGLTDSQTLTVVVDEVYEVLHYMVDGTTKIYAKTTSTPAGETAAFPCFIKNNGNVPIDVTLTLNDASLPANWTAKIVSDLVSMTEITGYDGIGIGETKSYYVLVATDVGNSVGDYGLASVTLTVNGQPTATITQQNLSFNTTISSDKVAPRWNVLMDNLVVAPGEQAVFILDLYNDNSVDMEAVITVVAPKDALGNELTGFNVEVYNDEGTVSGEFDENDKLIATPGNPSEPIVIGANSNKRFYVVVSVDNTTAGGTKATISVLATFTSIATRGTYATISGEIPAGEEEVVPIPTYYGFSAWAWIGIVLLALIVLALAIKYRGEVKRG